MTVGNKWYWVCGFAIVAAALLSLRLGTAGAFSNTVNQKSAQRWTEDMANFRWWDAKNSFPADAVLFVGSSSIAGWPTRTAFPDIPVINRGFGGSIYADIFHHAETVIYPYNPRLIVFYSGDNDLLWGKTPDQVAGDFEQILAQVRSRLPGTPVIVMAVKICEARIDRTAGYTAINAMFQKLADADDLLVYFDAASLLLDAEGKPDPRFFADDKLHLSAAGYKTWSDNLLPLIEDIISPDIESP